MWLSLKSLVYGLALRLFLSLAIGHPLSPEDTKFYEFTPKNIKASVVVDFYRDWVMEDAKNNSEAKAGRFEWKRFDAGDDKELRRRVYFTFMIYSRIHDFAQLQLKALTEVHLRLIGLVSELIETFTYQQNPQKKELCEVITYIVTTLVFDAMESAFLMLTGVIKPLADTGKLAQTAVRKVAEGSVGKAIKKKVEKAAKKALDKMTADMVNFAKQIAIKQANGNSYNAAIANQDQNWLIYGASINPLCSAFDGDFPDMNPKNKERLLKNLGDSFGDLKESVEKIHNKLFEGNYQDGELDLNDPSLTYIAMTNMEWKGEDSIETALKAQGNARAEVDLQPFGLGTFRTSGQDIPVCVYDYGKIDDFMAGTASIYKSWVIPLICGDFHGNQTVPFMKALSMDTGSSFYKGNTHPIFQTDRIPRQLESRSAYKSYTALCKLGYWWPDSGRGEDMDFDAANRAFCTSPEGKKAMARKTPWVLMSPGNTHQIPEMAKLCSNFLDKYKRLDPVTYCAIKASIRQHFRTAQR
ncbi:hypothetical protein G7Y89_g11902 [Cudoniella acicularis]|uniref:Uncharacterized protein n=1 Tax=Cudoniella acicularis TaxID=354080 RepID=A0A8H4RCV2_9HELO|nr:hypothetical protein G7Y89_g11902 [Cudoniella acicularis]